MGLPSCQSGVSAAARVVEKLQHFVRVVRGEAEKTLPREQIELMRIVALAYRSAEEKREISASE